VTVTFGHDVSLVHGAPGPFRCCRKWAVRCPHHPWGIHSMLSPLKYVAAFISSLEKFTDTTLTGRISKAVGQNSVQAPLGTYTRVRVACRHTPCEWHSHLCIVGSYLGIDVAIKEVLPSTEYDVSKYFEREWRLLKCV